MASNAPTRKPSNLLSNRMNYRTMKLELPHISRSYQQPPIVSVNAKDANKDKDRERKLKRQSSTPKQYGKRLDAPSSTTATAGTGVGTGTGLPLAPSSKTPSNERTVVLTRHGDQSQYLKQARKSRLEGTVSRTRGLRPPTADTLTPKQTKEAKSPDKAEAGANRPVRTKNQSHNTKIFFDKYLKFAYDLSTPDGVRQLEAHFFPAETQQTKQNRKKSEPVESTEKHLTLENKVSMGPKPNDNQSLQ